MSGDGTGGDEFPLQGAKEQALLKANLLRGEIHSSYQNVRYVCKSHPKLLINRYRHFTSLDEYVW